MNLAGLNLASGNHSLWAVAYDKAGAVSNVVEQKFSLVPPPTSTYNSTSGYGLINAAAAVAKAIGQNTFADVTNLGGNDWGADLVKAPEVWAKGYTGKGIVVAVLDTGVDYNHTDLKGNIWTNSREIIGNGKDDDGNGFVDDVYGWNFHDKNNKTLDTHGHGTHVAGTIAGVRNNFGVTGIAYDAKIMSVKVLGNEGGSSLSVAGGIRYAVNNGANVINMSLGSNSPSSDILAALQYASSKGVIVVMAAGNDRLTLPGFPARYADKWGIAVGAVDRNNNMASFSNRAGSNPLAYVTAPGVSIYSTIPGNGYSFMSGTSMAAPHVAGVVALMLSANRSLSDSRVREIVTQSAFNGQNSAFVTNNALSTSTVNTKTSLAYSINQNTFSSTTPKIVNLKTDLNAVYSFKEGNMFANPINWLQSTSFYQKIQLESAANPQTILNLDKKHLLQ
ncbi:S8 family peptidase [Calothrix sp. PCC 6303]|uniref:S8 family peptidase n=1 Tax=Calothrix sp. PCC 6303 TaxID=1170562 RepID=UPI001939CEF1|nr:S8 family peptidase [Calothrix sp. PCC 6303]